MRFFSGQYGYTFVELLLAVTILALITAPLLGLLATGSSAIQSAGQQTAAVSYARSGMEAVKSMGYAATFDYYVDGGNSPAVEPSNPGLPQFSRVTEVSLLPPGELNMNGLELLWVRVRVSWPGRGTERSVTLESYLAPQE